ncbi:hypothetical protein SAMN05518672_101115 [Chitinophaga sp. CF118]|uniref:hypothetical protein n=1 Tax=Chitinophaga sp. CF118 TaxID=1884367 RepID=UPI0008E582DF|nr:hypothetical protein [Chitinophaga sp. CF118]SFD02866.1 hypothetical protein SAMN05518672_101115 [Chitinophaga sp. CF118]
MRLQTPILLLIFNRPEQTQKIFEQIRLQQPVQLFIAADGPRFNKPEDAELCEKTKQVVLQRIDWKCDVKTLFQITNQGCGKAVSNAISWFFEHVEEGIILEDDCLPDATFFSFCSNLLERYRKDEKIMHISGTNYQMGTTRGDGSYYFSYYTHIWGWASWRRAWKKYDYTLNRYKDISREGLNTQLQDDLQTIYSKKIDTWDIQWFMTVWFNKGWTITPNTNLIRNIGCGKMATHTKHKPVWFKKLTYGSITEIKHPVTIEIDEKADQFSADTLFKSGNLLSAVRKIVKTVLPHKLLEFISG